MLKSATIVIYHTILRPKVSNHIEGNLPQNRSNLWPKDKSYFYL